MSVSQVEGSKREITQCHPSHRALAKSCEWCGQPAARSEPTLCAECYYKYWEKTTQKVSKLMTIW